MLEILILGRKKRLAMLDLLLAAENEGLIDYEGVKEEVDTFTFEVSINQKNSITPKILIINLYWYSNNYFLTTSKNLP